MFFLFGIRFVELAEFNSNQSSMIFCVDHSQLALWCNGEDAWLLICRLGAQGS